MPITVFRARLDEAYWDEYLEIAKEMDALVRTMPGYVSHKRFTADDGERVTIVEFEDEGSQRGWAENELHLQARRFGREKGFSTYDIAVCEVTRRYLKP